MSGAVTAIVADEINDQLSLQMVLLFVGVCVCVFVEQCVCVVVCFVVVRCVCSCFCRWCVCMSGAVTAIVADEINEQLSVQMVLLFVCVCVC